MSTQALKDTIKRELPNWLRDDPAFRSYVLELTRDAYAGRRETEDWFQQTLAEMRRERERQDVRWHESQAELKRMREEHERKWEENQAELRRMREDDARKWEEQGQKWEEQNQKWAENQAELKALHQEIMAIAQRQDLGIETFGDSMDVRSLYSA